MQAVTYVSRKTGIPAQQGFTNGVGAASAPGSAYGKAPTAYRAKAKSQAKTRAPFVPRAQAQPRYPPLPLVPVPPAQPQQPQPEPDPIEAPIDEPAAGGQRPRAGWTSEQVAEAKASASDIFQAGLREDMSRQVRVNMFGGTIGVDLREFFPAQFSSPTVQAGQMLPSGRGFRLRPDEWEALKAVSGDIDAALHSVIGAPPAAQQ